MRLRSLLFAPANRPELVAKLPRSGPDGVVLDLEDAVPPAEKERARELAPRGVADLIDAAPQLLLFVRVNAPGGELLEADLEALTPGLTGVVVPKLESAEQVGQLRASLEARGLGRLRLLAGIETAAGVAAARGVAAAGVAGVYFGAEDFIADMAGERTESNLEVLHARSEVALASRLGGAVALDQVVVDIRDLERVRRESAEARALGYSGKLCIHPDQVPAVNEAFTPTEAELDRSRRLVEAYEAAGGEQRGVIQFEGQMIDRPLVRRARSVLVRAGLGDERDG